MFRTYNQNGNITFDSNNLPLSFNAFYDIQLSAFTPMSSYTYYNVSQINSGCGYYELNIAPLNNYPIIVPVAVEFLAQVSCTPIFSNGKYRKIILKIFHAEVPPPITAAMKLRVYIYTSGQDTELPDDSLRIRSASGKLSFTANSKTTKVASSFQVGLVRNVDGNTVKTYYYVGAVPSLLQSQGTVATYNIPEQSGIVPIIINGAAKRIPPFRLNGYFWDNEYDWIYYKGSFGWGLFSSGGKYKIIKTMPYLALGEMAPSLTSYLSYEIFYRTRVLPCEQVYVDMFGFKSASFFVDHDLIATVLTS